jgi:hypothetical protein
MILFARSQGHARRQSQGVIGVSPVRFSAQGAGRSFFDLELSIGLDHLRSENRRDQT